MQSTLKITTIAVVLTMISTTTRAQISLGNGTGDDYLNTVTTAVPFLRIAPDARSGGMADVGLAISPDANSIFWNPAKTVFIDNEHPYGMSLTYTPWLSNLVNDIYLAYLNGYWKVDELSAVSASLRYFSLGTITFTDASGNVLQDFRPNEFAFDVAYSRKLADNLSAGLDLKYLYSNLATDQVVNGVQIKPARGVAADISMFYHTKFDTGDKDSELGVGLNISNIGNKITYTSSIEKDFIPTNLGLGAAYTVNFDSYNALTFAVDMNKLLVPTPDSTDADNDGILDFKEESTVSGMLGSFSDAPNGASEEFHEIMWSTGLEYWYAERFAVRTGYFYEHATKGGRQYFTVGLGLRYSVFGLDFSYLVPTSNNQNPLDNTLRFTLIFNLENLKGGGSSEDSGSDS
ncbi:MAG TPA: type IX secretion system outer membrane channel protein PorV [Chitinophagales bacterium]|nr:type IX secretion system outer membrane channel protein PorV [Chitinophagales bacterium]